MKNKINKIADFYLVPLGLVYVIICKIPDMGAEYLFVTLRSWRREYWGLSSSSSSEDKNIKKAFAIFKYKCVIAGRTITSNITSHTASSFLGTWRYLYFQPISY